MRASLALGTAVLAFAGVSITASSASAATPCWRAVIADWSRDASIDGHYSAACLRAAMQNAPTDVKIYSSLEDDLQAALGVRSARRLAGVHVTAASLDASGRSSSAPFLIALFGGLAGLVLAGATVVGIVRRRRGAVGS